MSTLLQRRWFARRIPAPKRGPAARLALPATQSEGGLRFTEWLLLAVLSLAFLLSISTPLFGNKLYLTILNHFPLALMGPVLLLHIVGLVFNRNVPRWQMIFAACWPLVLLAAYALVGSSVAKWALKERDTYFTFAIYLGLLPLYAACVPSAPARAKSWAQALVAVLVVFSLASLVGAAVRRSGNTETLHEIEYLVISGVLTLYYAVNSTRMRQLALALLVVAVGVNLKLTGFIIAALALLHIGLGSGWRRLAPQWRGAYTVAAAVGLVLVTVTLTVLYFTYREHLPSGNADVRLRQYEAVWRQFVASPVWGHAYLENSGEDYTESFRVLNLPTHSDVLDILKHGGLIGLALFSWGYWKIFALVHRAVRATRGQRWLNAYFIGMRFFQVTALVTFAINPILLKGPFLIVIWGNLGLAIGLALAATRPAPTPGGA